MSANVGHTRVSNRTPFSLSYNSLWPPSQWPCLSKTSLFFGSTQCSKTHNFAKNCIKLWFLIMKQLWIMFCCSRTLDMFSKSTALWKMGAWENSIKNATNYRDPFMQILSVIILSNSHISVMFDRQINRSQIILTYSLMLAMSYRF